MDEQKKTGFLRGYRGFTVFATGTLMCLGLSGYALYKGSPIGEIVQILYWWLGVAGMWYTKMTVEKVGVKKEQ